MMGRPIINNDILHFLRDNQQQFSDGLKDLQNYANQNNVPIIPHETALFLKSLVQIKNPQKILEVGTAIGFSAYLMASYSAKECHIDTIDRFPVMISHAKANFKKYHLNNKITLHEGSADIILPTFATNTYDLIFLDCSKQWYTELLELSLPLLKDDGIILIDDIFQGGDILKDEEEFPNRKNKKIRQGLRKLIKRTVNSDDLDCTILPLGDGLMMLQKIN